MLRDFSDEHLHTLQTFEWEGGHAREDGQIWMCPTKWKNEQSGLGKKILVLLVHYRHWFEE